MSKSSNVILITGASGFLGSHLARDIGATQKDINILTPNRTQLDLQNTKSVDAYIKKHQPSLVFHLAAEKFGSRDHLVCVNTLMTINLLMAIAKAKLGAKLIIASSAAEYGSVARRSAIAESYPCRPNNPYGISKYAQSQVGLALASALGIDLRVARIFNIIAQDCPRDSAVGSFIRQLNTRKSRLIKTGPLNMWRDFLYVSDVTRALIAISQKGKPGQIYNVCSGKSLQMKEILTMLINAWGNRHKISEGRTRGSRSTINYSQGSNKKLKTHTGWRPLTPISAAIKSFPCEN